MLFAMLRLIQLDVTVLINNENSRTLSIVSEGQGEGTWRIKYDKPNFLSINYFQLTIYIKLSDTLSIVYTDIHCNIKTIFKQIYVSSSRLEEESAKSSTTKSCLGRYPSV